MELLVRLTKSGINGALDTRIQTTEKAKIVDVLTEISTKLMGGERGFEVVNTRTGVKLNASQTLKQADIVDGDNLEIRPPGGYTSPAAPGSQLLADVVAGPNIGASYTLNPGTWTLGRAGDCSIVVPDREVTWRHVQISVSQSGEVTITPMSTDHAVLRNGEPMGGPFLLNSDDTLQLGQTVIAIRSVAASDEHRDAFGHIEFNRIPYVRTVPEEIKIGVVPTPPARPKPNPWRWAAILAPILMGVVMVVVMGNPRFAIFALMSPVVAIGNFIENRVGGKKSFINAGEEWEKRLDELEERLTDALITEQGQRLRAGPSVTECARRARTRQTRLWERSREDGDFLDVRLGLGSVPSVVTLEWPPSDDARLDEVKERYQKFETCEEVPIIAHFKKDEIVGVYGPSGEADGLANSIIIQQLALHSPEELVLAAVIGEPPTSYEWLKWVPHLRSAASPLAGSHLTLGAEAGNDLLLRLLLILSDEEQQKDGKLAGAHLLLFVHEDSGVDRALLANVLELSEGKSVSVLWVGTREVNLPRQCKSIVRLVSGGRAGLVRHTEVGVPDQPFTPEIYSPTEAEEAARTLSPLRDVTAVGGSNSLPRLVTLDTILGPARVEEVGRNWEAAKKTTDLTFPLGLHGEGLLNLDLVEDGPHALIAGTSGAGKSELLQTMVVGLASRYGPDRLTFLFIDYKGGAAFAPFEELPHAVGFVTDLDQAGSLRALTSLRAEIRRREGMLEGKARDLQELRQVAPHVAPPSLVIVVDEFATLVREIPDFVTGVVDVAQRGRSLGVHLVLATQRPTGVVNDNILANTNLRISLRVVDPADSMSIIGDREAAEIPAPLKGRALVKTGVGTKTLFQTAWGGAKPQKAGEEKLVIMEPFTLDAPAAAGGIGAEPGVRGETQLDKWVAAVHELFSRSKAPRPRRPWLDPLEETVDVVTQVTAAERQMERKLLPHEVIMGVIDDPTRQIQEPLVVDLESSGGALCFGSGGSGKTTWLRTMAFEQSRRFGSDSISILAMDFASRGLDVLGNLPQCGGVANGEDLDAVTRMVVWLENELETRRRILAQMKAATWSQVLAKNPQAGPHHLVMVDSFGGYVSALEPFGYGKWTDVLVRVLTEGRQVGIHALLTADRRSSVPTKLISAIEMRIVLRMNERDDLNLLEIDPKAVPEEQPPGRGMLRGNVLCQVAVVGVDGEHEAQDYAVAALGKSLSAMPKVQTFTTWPAALSKLPLSSGASVALGWDEWGNEIKFSFEDGGLLVCGASETGKTTLLQRVAASLPDVQKILLAGLRGPLVGNSMFHAQAIGMTSCAEMIEAVTKEYSAKMQQDGKLALLIVADDADLLMDGPVAANLEALAKLPGVALIAAADAFAATRTFSGWAALLKRSRRIALLAPDMIGDEEVLGVRLKLRPGIMFQPGRGLIMEGSSPRAFQVGVF